MNNGGDKTNEPQQYDPFAEFEDESEPYLPLRERRKAEQREQHFRVLKDDGLQAQLFEEFINFDSWILFSEAIPLAMGIHPNHSDTIGLNDFEIYKDIGKLVRATIGANSLILNPLENEDLWRVKPNDFAKWLISKKIVPIEPIRRLALGKAASSSAHNSGLGINTKAERHAVIREKIYIAALACIANIPEQCKGQDGNWSPTAIARQIEEKAPFWFGDLEAPLSTRKKKELIASALNSMGSL